MNRESATTPASDRPIWDVQLEKTSPIPLYFQIAQMIEQAIYEHPAVNEVLVVGVPDSYRGESAKAFVSLRPGAEPFTLEALREFLRDKLGPHEMPAALEFRAALPRTPVGKLSKIELRDEARKAQAAQ